MAVWKTVFRKVAERQVAPSPLRRHFGVDFSYLLQPFKVAPIRVFAYVVEEFNGGGFVTRLRWIVDRDNGIHFNADYTWTGVNPSDLPDTLSLYIHASPVEIVNRYKLGRFVERQPRPYCLHYCTIRSGSSCRTSTT